MVIETQLSRTQFTQLALLRHFQRPMFYVAALSCTLLTTVAIVQSQPLLLLVAWPPFLLYILIGVASTLRACRQPDFPVFLPTRYDFGPTGIAISTPRDQSQIVWADVTGWRVLANCYVLSLADGSILAIPQTAIAKHRTDAFEQLLREQIST